MKPSRTFNGERTKKVALIAGILSILCAGIAGSYFKDSDVSTENEIILSTFDIKVNEMDDQGPVVKIPCALSGDSYITTIPIRLVGKGKGKLIVSFNNIQNGQGVQTEPEIEAENASGGPVFNVSDQVFISVNGGSRSTLKESLTKTVGNIQAGETTIVAIKLDVKTTAKDVYQGDFSKFDIIFSCEQLAP